MGLDIALGVIVLIAAIRGWIQGFVYQAIRLAGLVACIYLAAPVRDRAKPFLLPHLPTIQPELVDRLFWWVSAAVCYVLVVGLATLVIKMTRRPEIPGMPQPRRNDQFAGFLVGIAKGALVAAFVTAGIQKYALSQLAEISWADQQVKNSQALRWNDQYRPAARIWTSPPARHFVNHIQRMGLQSPADALADPDEKAEGRPVVQTASRGPEPGLKGVAVPRLAPVDDAAARPAPEPAPAAQPKAVEKDKVLEAIDEIESTLEAKAKSPN